MAKATTTTAAAKPIVYYQDKGFLVTSSKAKSPTRTYRVDKIEKVSLRNDPFYFAASFSALVGMFFITFNMAQWLLTLSLIPLYILSRISVLYVTSKAVSEIAFIGTHERLQLVREAIEKAMHKDDPDDGLAADHDKDDDDEDED